MELRIIKGPPVARMSRTAAEKKLQEIPQMKDASSFELREIDGIWVAAVAFDKESATKESTPPPFAPPEEEAPAEGPPSDGPPSEDGPPAPEEGPSDDEGGEEKPKGEKGEKKGLEHQVEALTHMLTKLMDALGLSDPMGGPEGPMGHEGDPSAPPMDGPPMPPGDAPGSDGKTHTVHERALKPGEAPPGTLPVGSPSFASIQPTHPWKDYVGVKRSFTLEEPIGDRTMASVRDELNALAQGTGYAIKRAKEGLRDGIRVARVIVQADTPVS